MAKVELKKPVVEEISELLNGAATAVVVDYRGLTVAEDTELRKQLREAGVVYKVYKNTMINFAIKDTEFADLAQHLEGQMCIRDRQFTEYLNRHHRNWQQILQCVV